MTDFDEQEVHAAVQQIWSTVLGVRNPAPEDDFFRSGGNSILAVDLITQVEGRLGIKFPIESLFLDGTFGKVFSACAENFAQTLSRVEP